jgi:hypothetical protein
MAAFNISSSKNIFDFQSYRSLLNKIDFIDNIEHKLIITSLYFANFKDYEKKLYEYTSLYEEKLSFLPLRNVQGLICGLILMSSKASIDSYVKKFTAVFNSIKTANPLFNTYEYSPFILLASINSSDKYSYYDTLNELYYDLHEAEFARGTNSYCTALYLLTLNKKIRATKLRNIYVNLKNILPMNQFNYLSCAQFYTCNEDFSDYDSVAKIYVRISSEVGVKWFTEQLDMVISCAMYLKSEGLNPLKHMDLDITDDLSTGLLSTMIVSTILLNNAIN